MPFYGFYELRASFFGVRVIDCLTDCWSDEIDRFGEEEKNIVSFDSFVFGSGKFSSDRTIENRFWLFGNKNQTSAIQSFRRETFCVRKSFKILQNYFIFNSSSKANKTKEKEHLLIFSPNPFPQRIHLTLGLSFFFNNFIHFENYSPKWSPSEMTLNSFTVSAAFYFSIYFLLVLFPAYRELSLSKNIINTHALCSHDCPLWQLELLVASLIF